MSRKDIIIITVLINTGLLAILFATAIITSEEDTILQDSLEITTTNPQPFFQEKGEPVPFTTPVEVKAEKKEVKKQEETGSKGKEEIDQQYFEEPITETLHSSQKPEPEQKYIEITVKRGDSLDKISKANGTTIEAIKAANNLKSERLDVGQILRIPVEKKKKGKTDPVSINKKNQESGSNSEYYVIKSGDNPWKIAKEFHVKYDDLLRINNLDEEKARNLKIGDRIKIR